MLRSLHEKLEFVSQILGEGQGAQPFFLPHYIGTTEEIEVFNIVRRTWEDEVTQKDVIICDWCSHYLLINTFFFPSYSVDFDMSMS